MKRILRSDFKIVTSEKTIGLTSGQLKGAIIPISGTELLALSMFSGDREDMEIEREWKQLFPSSRESVITIANRQGHFVIPVSLNEQQFGIKHRDIHLTSTMLSVAHRQEKFSRLPFPGSIVWNISHQCHRGCIYCYERHQSDFSKKSGALDRTEIEYLMKEIFESGCPRVLLTGGEPFSNPEVYDILRRLLSMDIKVKVLTKARLEVSRLTNDAIANLDLYLSMDSMNIDTAQKLVKEPGYYEDMIRNMEELRLEEIPYSVAAVACRENQIDLLESIDKWLLTGARKVWISRYQSETEDNLWISDQEWFELRNRLNAYYKEQVLVENSTKAISKRCTSGESHMALDMNGDYVFCESCPDIKRFDNFRTWRLLDMWNSNSYLSYCQKEGENCVFLR